MNANASNLELLNSFREAEGKAPFADWRKARHQPMLDAYMAAAEAEQAAHEEAAEEEAEIAAAPEPKTESYKHLARKAPVKSGVVSPVAFVHSFLDAHPDLKRKQAMAALIAEGVNFSTARTQYQKWFAAKKAAK